MIPVVDNILGHFSYDLGIDLGTANTLVGVGNKGIVLREPSIVCRHRKTRAVIAVGSVAKKMLGRVPPSVEVLRPMQNGVIADFDITHVMLAYFVKKIHESFGKVLTFFGPRVVLGVPTNISQVQQRAVVLAAFKSGARKAYLIEEPMAAAIGAGLPVTEPVGSMIVNVGGGTSEVAIISSGGVVVGRSLKIAGDRMDQDIISYVRSRWGLAIGEATAEEIKINLGSAYPYSVEREMVIRGRDLEKGIPRSVKVTSGAIRESLSSACAAIVTAVRETIEDAPPELVADIAERGLVICGGGSQLAGFAKFISSETKLPVVVADDPTACVVTGTIKAVADRSLLTKVKLPQS